MKRLILKSLSWLYNKIYYSQFKSDLVMKVDDTIEEYPYVYYSLHAKSSIWTGEYGPMPTVEQINKQFENAKALYGDKV